MRHDRGNNTLEEQFIAAVLYCVTPQERILMSSVVITLKKIVISNPGFKDVNLCLN
jgi:hypothetical protein